LNNDTDPNGETLTATLATKSNDGTVIMNSNGTFTFTPDPGFSGSFTRFTYTVSDHGYTPLTATATVYIYFSQVTTLPIQLLRFSGTADSKMNLTWSVAANETRLLFEVQRSCNGSAFQSIARIFTTEKAGNEQYQFVDVLASQTTSYRLKVVNKDGTAFFSPVVWLKPAAADDKITLLQNPVQSTLQFIIPASTHVTGIVIYNMAGIIVYREKKKIGKDTNTISLTLQASLPQGTYLLQVLTTSGSKTTIFVKQ